MRKFTDGAEIVVEPWRARAFPIIKDLMCDRSAFDRIVEAGGFITAPTEVAFAAGGSIAGVGPAS